MVSVAEVHDRMPVLLAETDFESWLSGCVGQELLKPASDDLLQKWPVSKRVNSSRAPDDDPTLRFASDKQYYRKEFARDDMRQCLFRLGLRDRHWHRGAAGATFEVQQC